MHAVQVGMMLFVPAILFVSVAGSGMFLPPEQDEQAKGSVWLERQIIPVLLATGLIYAASFHLYVVGGNSSVLAVLIAVGILLTVGPNDFGRVHGSPATSIGANRYETPLALSPPPDYIAPQRWPLREGAALIVCGD